MLSIVWNIFKFLFVMPGLLGLVLGLAGLLIFEAVVGIRREMAQTRYYEAWIKTNAVECQTCPGYEASQAW